MRRERTSQQIVEQAYSQAMADPLPPEASAFDHMLA